MIRQIFDAYKLIYNNTTFQLNRVSLSMIVVMARPIHLFRSVLEYHSEVGIYARQSEEKWQFNKINALILVSYQTMNIATLMFLLFGEKTVIEFGTCFYGYITTMTAAIVYLVLRSQFGNTTKYIEGLEKFIGKSKYKHN